MAKQAPQVEIARMSLANTGVDIHVDADSLIRDNRERLRFRANTDGSSCLHVQNIIARR